MAEQLVVRASALETYLDCPRRWAASTLPELADLYELNPKRNSVGAAIGTTLHSLMAELFRTKKAVGFVGYADVEAATEKLWPDFIKEAGMDCIWDATTSNEVAARKQLLRMTEAFLPIVELTNPQHIELALEKQIDPLNCGVTMLLSGHLDVVDTRNDLADHKTGKTMPSPFAQLGAYAILCELNDIKIEGCRVNYVPRVGVTKLDGILCRSDRLSVDECCSTAWTALEELQRHYVRWLDTKDKRAFPANNRSMTCTLNYCNAHSTACCAIGKRT